MITANFIAFLKQLNVPIVDTAMTFGVSRDQGAFEWSGTSPSAIFAQPSNLLRPSMWRMLFDIFRFNQFALDLLSHEDQTTAAQHIGTSDSIRSHPNIETIGEYLEREHYSASFRDDYLIPMTAAVWSTSPDKCSLQFPAVTLARFMWNHHLLTAISARPTWMTVRGGAQNYIDAVISNVKPSNIHLSTPIKSLSNTPDGKILLETSSGREVFDHVILATHGDQAYRIIESTATTIEKEVMQNFKTSDNIAVLHSDLSLMPQRKIAWAAWNYLTTTAKVRSASPACSTSSIINDTPRRVDQVCLTYNMNILQHIPTPTFGDVLVTLNPLHKPDPALTQGTWHYSHPLYNAAAIDSQARLPTIQNTRGISYVGAWTKYGFHEDGFSSGIKAAVDHLGATLPFTFIDSTFSRGKRPVITTSDLLARRMLTSIQMVITLLDGVFQIIDTYQHPRRAMSSSKTKKVQ